LQSTTTSSNGWFDPDELRVAEGLPTMFPDSCQNCGKRVRVQIFKGEPFCSDNCRKALGKDIK
jgi:hypothetical protein